MSPRCRRKIVPTFEPLNESPIESCSADSSLTSSVSGAETVEAVEAVEIVEKLLDELISLVIV